MRRGFYVLMMLVLVLRGLTGTAMAAGLIVPLHSASPAAVGAAVHTADTVHPAATHGGEYAHAPDTGHQSAAHSGVHAHDSHVAKAPCHGADHAGCAKAGAMHMSGSHHPGESTCSACEICHSAMLALPLVAAGAPARTGTLPPDASAHFHSAPAALAFEPPIA